MSVFEDKNFVVKTSEIEGYGLFTKRSFKMGEKILVWNPRILSESDMEKITKSEARYINTLDNGTIVLMNIPERFVNHSEAPNSSPEGKSDVAIRDIEVGEEITSSYDFES